MAGIVTSGITYEELREGSGRGTIADDGSAERSFIIAWSDLGAFINALVGGYFKLNNTNFYYTYPDQHPDWPLFYCQSTDYEGAGTHSLGANGQIVFEKAIVRGKYSPLKYDANLPINSLFVEELDWSAEQLVIPGGSFKSPGGAEIIQEPIRKIIPTVDYTLTIEGAPDLPGGDATVILNATASPLNASLFLGAAPKKIMYKGARASRTTTNRGTGKYKIIHRFCYRPIEWTKVWSKVAGDFVEVTAVNGGAPLYGTSDLTQLLPR